jgi:hypothetical protein
VVVVDSVDVVWGTEVLVVEVLVEFSTEVVVSGTVVDVEVS